jgi:hypothetical protein
MNDQPVEAGEDSKPFRTLAGIRPESTPIRMRRGRFVRIFRLALPIAATEVPVVVTIAIDTVLLGQLGASAVAASALGAAVFLFVASICVSIVSSVGHEAAFRCGRRQTRAPNSSFASAAALACVLGRGRRGDLHIWWKITSLAGSGYSHGCRRPMVPVRYRAGHATAAHGDRSARAYRSPAPGFAALSCRRRIRFVYFSRAV